MGLTATVGLVGAALASGDAGWDYLQGQLDDLNALLGAAGLPAHREPEAGEELLEVALGGYGALHRLRDAAVALGGERFDHLLLHSDHDGFYVPIPFERVLRGDAGGVGEVGSSYALRDELETLARSLEPGSVEAVTCAGLLEAAVASLERGALLMFA